MTTNQKTQNSWVSDLNKSAENIQKKEKTSKLLKYFFLFAGFGFLIFLLVYLGKSKLHIVNPKLEPKNGATVEKILPEKTIISAKQNIEKNVNDIVDIANISKSNPSEIKIEKSKLEKNRPKKSLNSKIENNTMQSNKKNGKHITYYDNGKKWVELNFVNGLREGTQYTWHRNGQLKSELNYENGKKHGVQKWWQKDGKILNEKVYSHGEWQKD